MRAVVFTEAQRALLEARAPRLLAEFDALLVEGERIAGQSRRLFPSTAQPGPTVVTRYTGDST